MDPTKRKPRAMAGPSKVLLGGADSQNFTPTHTEYQAALAYLISKYGVPRARVRTVAELAGIGGVHDS